MTSQDEAKIVELRALVEGIRDRVRAQYPSTSVVVDANSPEPIRVPLADLMPVVHARDAAQAKMASIGSVNPRRGGVVNNTIQFVKRNVARSLNWFVRDQIVFNRGALACVEALVESVNELNRSLSSLGAQIGDRLEQHRHMTETRLQPLEGQARQLSADVGKAMALAKVSKREYETILRAVIELKPAFEKRTLALEASYRDLSKAQHSEFEAELTKRTQEIQELLWKDMERMRANYERLIHTELRTIRQRQSGPSATPPATAQNTPPRSQSQDALAFDYQAFAERFRGSEEYVKSGAEFYVPYFQGMRNVLDIGCGRGEFLQVMRTHGIEGHGIDLSQESVEQCKQKGLEAEVADLFEYLSALPDHSLPAIFSAQVVEHLPPDRLPEMIRLCAAKLEPGGLLALETPNPESLPIFATYFFLDPTHTRPVPHPVIGVLYGRVRFGPNRNS